MPSRLSVHTRAVKEWFQIHGKVVFTFAVFNVLLIAVFKFRFMFFWIFFFTAYMVYILREINQTLTRVSNVIRYEPEDLRHVVQGINAMKRHMVEQCEGFEDLLKKIIRIMPEHPVDVRDAVYSFQDVTEDLLSKIKEEIRMLRMDWANDQKVKEEMVELSASSAEASGVEESEVPVVPTITPKPKRGRKPNTSGSSSTSSAITRPLLSSASVRLCSRRANEMIQQATQ